MSYPHDEVDETVVVVAIVVIETVPAGLLSDGKGQAMLKRTLKGICIRRR